MKTIRNLIFIISLVVLVSPTLYSQGSALHTVVSLTGNVVNEITRQPETVKLIVFDKAGKRVRATRSIGSENGNYYITGLKPGISYEVRLSKRGFMKEIWKFTVPNTGQYTEMSHDFLIKPMEKGIEIPISVPPFEINKTKLRFGAEDFLEEMITTLKQNDKVKFQIVCYPDKKGNGSENLKLTNARAKSLKEYFIKQGIAADRIGVKGNKNIDPNPKNQPPTSKAAKGKRYIGPCYIKIVSF